MERIYYWALYFGDDYGLNSIASVHHPEMDGDLDTSVTFTLVELTQLNSLFDKTPPPTFDREDRFRAQEQLREYSNALKTEVRTKREYAGKE